MNPIRTLMQSILVGTSLMGLSAGLTHAQPQLPAGAEDMPAGYTLSKTPVSGKHCYHHGGGQVYFYCYSRTIQSSEIKSHNSMMMKKDSSMMKKDDSMMKKDDSMMMHK
jgi:hypothetical protein